MNGYLTAMIQLPLVREARGEKVRTPADVARICDDIRNLAQETMHVLVLDSKNNLIGRHMISLGLADATLVHPREIFRAAITDGSATGITLCHSHPSGDPSPSAEDVRITRQMIQAGKILGIDVIDHVILGRPTENERGYVSMREVGLCEFGKT